VCECVPQGFPPDTAPAFHSPQTAPSWRRARHGGRRAAFCSDRLFRSRRSHAPPRHGLAAPESWRTGNQRAPSVGIPERFTRALVGFSPSVRRQPPPAFQSDIPLRSGCLRVSGAVAPSATVQSLDRLSRRDRLPDSTKPRADPSIPCMAILPRERPRATAAANRLVSQSAYAKSHGITSAAGAPC